MLASALYCCLLFLNSNKDHVLEVVRMSRISSDARANEWEILSSQMGKAYQLNCFKRKIVSDVCFVDVDVAWATESCEVSF
jgi:hypothetical protein